MAPESTCLLGRDPGAWFRSLSHAQSIDVACQLHRAVCLMTSNLNILHQYVLYLKGTATKLFELTLNHRGFPSAAVASAAQLHRVSRASVHMDSGALLWIQINIRR